MRDYEGKICNETFGTKEIVGPEGCPVLGATYGVQSGFDGHVEGPGYRMAGIMSVIYNHPHPRY